MINRPLVVVALEQATYSNDLVIRLLLDTFRLGICVWSGPHSVQEEIVFEILSSWNFLGVERPVLPVRQASMN